MSVKYYDIGRMLLLLLPLLYLPHRLYLRVVLFAYTEKA